MAEIEKESKPIALELATQQREISVAEFFSKNRHLLGFDNKKKALMTTIKEAVDNSLDACEEARIMPEISIEVIDMSNDRFRVIVEDNGPGIVKKQIPNIFARLLYGSKFHRMKQSLTADEPIIIQRNDKIEILPIGEFVDNFLEKEGEKEISKLNVFVPAFDKKNYSYSFRKVSHVIKHKRENEIIKITTTTNRTVKVTGCHSLFTQNNGEIKEVEARNLKINDFLITPTRLPETEHVKEINILDYISLKDIEKNWLYVYNIPDDVLDYILKNSKITHKKTSKSRRFYRIKEVDILDDSFAQYKTKKFIPLHLIFKLGLINRVNEGVIKSYYHGKETKIPVTIPLTKEFIEFLGLYIAEGHNDKRQIGLTFGRHEDYLIKKIINFAQTFGLNFSIENREKTIRIKIFGNIFVKLIKNICGSLAKNKKIPEFIFRINPELRQDFLDALYLGDGHNTKNRNQLMLSTISKKLANEVLYLWLMQGIHASISTRMNKGLGRTPTKTYVISIYGKDINKSNIFSCNIPTASKRAVQQLLQTSLSLLKIKKIEKIDEGYYFVYDLSIPECENFVGGIGGISCHNSRGQQGIGISASVMYSQLTTGRSAKITSKIGQSYDAHYYELHINTRTNMPEIKKEEIVEWKKERGTRVELDIEASYAGGSQSIDEYLKETAIANPYASIIYTNPKAEQIIFARVVNELPKEPKEIKPHPHGVELGIMMNMLKFTKAKTLQSFLTQEFTKVGSGTAKNICENAALLPSTKPKEMSREMSEKLVEGIKKTKIQNPPTDCLSPIGQEFLEKGLRKEINAEFYATITRPPAVYRGNPFQIEVGIAYGGSQPENQLIRLIRFANRVPLLYQQSACAINRSVINTNWHAYGLSQSQSALPLGPCAVVVHMVSVWVPFTSESKEAIAHYPEIIKEIKLALQECGRKLASYVLKKKRIGVELEKRTYIEKYIPHVGEALKELLNLKNDEEKKVEELLHRILEKERGKLEEVGFDETKNIEYDEEFAKIGKKVEEGDEGEEEENG